MAGRGTATAGTGIALRTEGQLADWIGNHRNGLLSRGSQVRVLPGAPISNHLRAPFSPRKAVPTLRPHRLDKSRYTLD